VGIQHTNKFTTVEQKNCNNLRGEYTDRTTTTTTGSCTPCTENQWVNNNVCTTYTYTSNKVTCNGSNGKFTPGTATSDQKCILCMSNQWVKPGQYTLQNDQCYDIITSRNTLNTLILIRQWNGKYGGKNYGPIKTWRLGPQITSLTSLFEGNTNFNEDISGWDVSNVMYMDKMFFNARNFNKQVNNWNVSKVENMQYMFRGASSFNQQVNNWNVYKVRTMIGMFMDAKNFNQSLSGWNTKLVNVAQMFKYADSFNKNVNLSGWTGYRENLFQMW
jgi:surface protein